MLLHLTTRASRETAAQQIAALIREHAEWLFVSSNGDTQSLRRSEIDFRLSHDRLLLSCWTEKGTRTWRILSWQWNGQTLVLKASRKFGAEQPLLELIPRASANAISATIRAARQLRCERIARLASEWQPQTTVERCALSPGTRRTQPGRYARILLRWRGERIAVTAPVISCHPSTIDAFLSAALLWFTRTRERSKPPYIEQLWLILNDELPKAACYRVALLRDSLREVTKLFVVDADLHALSPVVLPERDELWRKKLGRFPPVPTPMASDQVRAIIAEAPEAIDVVHSRRGQTLRYFGLPFARVRSLLGVERVWFGIDAAHRRVLDETSSRDWETLLRDLREHRSASSLDHRHAFYRSASEAWLESLLRRDITKLDPGLIIAPLHAQFRTAHSGKLGIRPIDLLALRQDGRLVVIELKASEDREHVLQGADYWRRVEAHRRRGHIAKAKLFGDRSIKDEPPLVYLVAPTLRVHPSFSTLARCISNDIEMYRFDINEDWRSGVRVMRRLRVN
ncbi:MAG TPA: hypothetical protein VFS77_18970 [Pyrinomonadaceae bacterium]|nr:hypothetical protein [Pyrinomonadaceae bacterium]